MTEKHKVRFEPVGIEIDVDEDQTILRAAAEQGIMLMHGCKEGRCASCKAFLLVGEGGTTDDVTHDMRPLVVRLVEPAGLKFFPGQYVDFAVPGHDETRSFSM